MNKSSLSINTKENIMLSRIKETVESLKPQESHENTDSNEDNWKHRSARMKCTNCMWYVPKGEGKIGRCRQASPTIKGWPVMFPTDWCGDHKLDEEKI